GEPVALDSGGRVAYVAAGPVVKVGDGTAAPQAAFTSGQLATFGGSPGSVVPFLGTSAGLALATPRNLVRPDGTVAVSANITDPASSGAHSVFVSSDPIGGVSVGTGLYSGGLSQPLFRPRVGAPSQPDVNAN